MTAKRARFAVKIAKNDGKTAQNDGIFADVFRAFEIAVISASFDGKNRKNDGKIVDFDGILTTGGKNA